MICPSCTADVHPIKTMTGESGFCGRGGQYVNTCPKCQARMGAPPVRNVSEDADGKSVVTMTEYAGAIFKAAGYTVAPSTEPALTLPAPAIPHGQWPPGEEPSTVAVPITGAMIVASAKARAAQLDSEIAKLQSMQTERALLQKIIGAAEPSAPVISIAKDATANA